MSVVDLANTVTDLVARKKYSEVKNLLPNHPEDIAELITDLPTPSCRLFVFRLVPYDKAVDVFEYLPTDDEEEMLNSLTSQEIKDILNDMSPDDRTGLFEEMPAEIVKRFLNFLTPQEKNITVKILNYPPDSVGRLITPDFVQLYESMSVQEALVHLRRVGMKQETIYYCYVLDSQKRLIGIVSLKKLVLADPDTEVRNITFEDVISVNVYDDKERAADIFKRYDLLVLPVVDNNNKLLGIVTFDDLVDVLEEEATEDFERIAAVVPVDKPYMEAGFFELVWKRSFWLIVLTVMESASSVVMQNFGDVIQQWVALTFFLPILVATGGNAGMQSAMMIIRGLATNDIGVKDFFRVVWRESLLGLFIGGVLALVGLARVVLQQSNWLLSVSVGTAMGVTIMLSAVLGAALPIVFRKLKLDPALMSGPLITTIVDVAGIFVYFQIARFILCR